MRRINLILVLILLAVPATASAKVGVELQTDPQALAPGEEVTMIVMLYREPRDPGTDPSAVVGAHPLVTFRNAKTGEVVRVRAGRTNHAGIARATVSFPSRGEWAVDLGNIKGVREEGLQTIPVGISASLPPEVVKAPARPTATSDEGRSPWPAVPLAIGVAFALLAAAAVVVVRRREASA